MLPIEYTDTLILLIESSSSFVLSKSVSISFKGQRLPNYLYLYMVRSGMNLQSPFIPKTTQYFSCFRFGHSKTQCKGYSRYIHCGERSHDQDICSKKDPQRQAGELYSP